MKRVAINVCYGGFSLSALACQEYLKLIGKPCYFFKMSLERDRYEVLSLEEASETAFFKVYLVSDPLREIVVDENGKSNYRELTFRERELSRENPNLIKVIETLGEKANGQFSQLKIVEIPDDVEWTIEEHDGAEWVAEKHRTWG